MVLSDRFYLDLLADPKRYRFGASLKIARFVFRFLPKPDRVIVLHADAKTILSRKEEVSREELDRQLTRYREISDNLEERAVVVDCGGEVDQVSEEVLKHILVEVRRRSR